MSIIQSRLMQPLQGRKFGLALAPRAALRFALGFDIQPLRKLTLWRGLPTTPLDAINRETSGRGGWHGPETVPQLETTEFPFVRRPTGGGIAAEECLQEYLASGQGNYRQLI